MLGDVGDQDIGAESDLGDRLVDAAGELVGDGQMGGVDDLGEHPRPHGLGAVVTEISCRSHSTDSSP
jgi:hypothetical protein